MALIRIYMFTLTTLKRCLYGTHRKVFTHYTKYALSRREITRLLPALIKSVLLPLCTAKTLLTVRA